MPSKYICISSSRIVVADTQQLAALLAKRHAQAATNEEAHGSNGICMIQEGAPRTVDDRDDWRQTHPNETFLFYWLSKGLKRFKRKRLESTL